MSDTPSRKAYRLLTGPDDAAFCQRVSDAIQEGYQLYGPPLMQVKPDGSVWVGQALVLPDGQF
jgi:hypothetical protein